MELTEQQNLVIMGLNNGWTIGTHPQGYDFIINGLNDCPVILRQGILFSLEKKDLIEKTAPSLLPEDADYRLTDEGRMMARRIANVG